MNFADRQTVPVTRTRDEFRRGTRGKKRRGSPAEDATSSAKLEAFGRAMSVICAFGFRDVDRREVATERSEAGIAECVAQRSSEEPTSRARRLRLEGAMPRKTRPQEERGKKEGVRGENTGEESGGLCETERKTAEADGSRGRDADDAYCIVRQVRRR
jgi:hypothetical protein